ncbi:hypothetical protein M9M90_13300 [Phenylobacterium sp. LH3H17]|uniref:hypothetical protein n=1 Tax=Phenylobacterium sp. LH3H17 TaxID=2903901 RepID=UPI0020C96140|nr:hypothetical protein [Phenylobacterium sp. LH3H17]UTP38194.1 hypothetical protein M9M90_13300 [Phenylobacterium sp. LH3H17]
MTTERMATLAKAKAMIRTLDSAPDPHGRARAIYADLGRISGWSKPEEARIMAFSQWLATRPPPGELKEQCRALLKTLD